MAKLGAVFASVPVVDGGAYPKMHVSCSNIVAPAGSVSSRHTAGNAMRVLHEQPSIRRSSAGNYSPPNWDFNSVQSLQNEYAAEEHVKRCEVLKRIVNKMLDQEMEVPSQMELIDALQRLGISYHFEEKIHSILCKIHSRDFNNNTLGQQVLYAKALEFKLLRQHGFYVSQGIFDSFKDENGAFKTSLWEDPKGMLCLYEASYLQIKNDETSLEMAREFTTKYLKRKLDENGFDEPFAALVRRSLELPLYWRMMRLEARWFIDLYEKRPGMNPILLELAKLDFNIVQKSHQNELKYLSRWWKNTGMGEALTFARDILVENFFWNLGIVSEREQGYCRTIVTKIAVLITIIDDIYDVYGTLDELELFTCAVERWDVHSIEQLPRYMKICFLALHNLINEMAYDALKVQGINIIPYLTKSWADLCRAYLQEAKWYYSGYVPKLHEYLGNAWISVSAPLVLLHVYICVSDPIKKEDLEYFSRNQNIFRPSAVIVRLTNDLGTSPLAEGLKSGDISKSIACYMKENQASEEEAREYIKSLINEAWKEMNMARLAESPLPPKFKEIAIDFARTAHCMYQHGDGHGHQNSEMANHISALLFEPICNF